MVTFNPKHLMLVSFLAVLLEAAVGSGGSLPVNPSESNGPAVAKERSVPRRVGDPTFTAQANLGLDLGKLGRRATAGDVYNMFPGASKPESAPPKQDRPRSKSKPAVMPPIPKIFPPLPSPGSVVALAPAQAIQIERVVEEDVPPPPQPVVIPTPPPPPPPVVIPTPPIPFKYAGTLRQSSGRTIYFLTKGNKLYTVEVGQVLDTNYSIDGEEGGQLTVTYLPLQRKQTISMGSPS